MWAGRQEVHSWELTEVGENGHCGLLMGVKTKLFSTFGDSLKSFIASQLKKSRFWERSLQVFSQLDSNTIQDSALMVDFQADYMLGALPDSHRELVIEIQGMDPFARNVPLLDHKLSLEPTHRKALLASLSQNVAILVPYWRLWERIHSVG